MLLEFWGARGPWRNPEAFVDAVRKSNPSITNAEIVTLVHRENARRRPRHSGLRLQIFGADILSDDLHSMDAWQFLSKEWKRDLPLFPVNGGAVIHSADAMADVRLKAAIDQSGKRSVNRATLIVPAGMSKTYVWCQQTNWVQDVTEADADILRNTPVLREMFADPNRVGPFVIRGFDYVARDTTPISTLQDAEAFERDRTRKPSWKGV